MTIETMPVITTAELQRDADAIVQRLKQRHERALINSDDTPMVVMLPLEDYEALKRYERLRAFDKLTHAIGQAVEKSGLSEDALMAELEETKREVFAETYGRYP
jgi:PHD/YefM family antitoxin component YafN of YafNO toxin-antitoxin module